MEILDIRQNTLLVHSGQYSSGDAAAMGSGAVHSCDAEACVSVPSGGRLPFGTGMGITGGNLPGTHQGSCPGRRPEVLDASWLRLGRDARDVEIPSARRYTHPWLQHHLPANSQKCLHFRFSHSSFKNDNNGIYYVGGGDNKKMLVSQANGKSGTLTIASETKAIGMQAAAKEYYGISVNELNRKEAVSMVICLPEPLKRAPFQLSPKDIRKRNALLETLSE